MNPRRHYTHTLTLIVIALLVTVLYPRITQADPGDPPPPFAPDRVLIAFYPGTVGAEISAAHSQVGGRTVNSIDALGVQVVVVPEGTAEEAVERYRRNPNVDFAELNYRCPLYQPATTEGSEPSLGIANNFTEQWALHNTGQSFGASVDPLFGTLTAPAYSGVAYADIDAPQGWDITHGSSDIWIAVLDSGVSCAHVDLVVENVSNRSTLSASTVHR